MTSRRRFLSFLGLAPLAPAAAALAKLLPEVHVLTNTASSGWKTTNFAALPPGVMDAWKRNFWREVRRKPLISGFAKPGSAECTDDGARAIIILDTEVK